MTLAQVAVEVPLRGVVVEVPVAKAPGPRAAGRGLLNRTPTRRIRLCACTRTSHGAAMTPAALRTVRRSMRPPSQAVHLSTADLRMPDLASLRRDKPPFTIDRSSGGPSAGARCVGRDVHTSVCYWPDPGVRERQLFGVSMRTTSFSSGIGSSRTHSRPTAEVGGDRLLS
jgi:hypothetical protein